MSTALSLPNDDDDSNSNDPASRSAGFADDAPNELPTEGPKNYDGQSTSVETPPSNGPVQAPPDPFDPANLRLSQNFLTTGGVKKHVTSVPVRKPTKEEWFQVNPSPGYTLDTLVMELKNSKECYLVSPTLRDELTTEPTVYPRRLHVALNRDGTVFIWPLRLPSADGRQDRWAESALAAAEAAKSDWVRLQADLGSGAYVFFTPQAELPPAQWPDMPFAQLLKLAFRNSFIETTEHVVLRRLRGEV
jgi:hypothetical protein